MFKRPLNQLEGHVIQAFNDLEFNKTIGEFLDLHHIAITSVKEIVVHPCRKAILITIPYRLIKNIQSIQSRLVIALTKKFCGKDVMFVADYRIKPKFNIRKSNQGVRSRTLSSVHEAMLDNLVYP